MSSRFELLNGEEIITDQRSNWIASVPDHDMKPCGGAGCCLRSARSAELKQWVATLLSPA